MRSTGSWVPRKLWSRITGCPVRWVRRVKPNRRKTTHAGCLAGRLRAEIDRQENGRFPHASVAPAIPGRRRAGIRIWSGSPPWPKSAGPIWRVRQALSWLGESHGANENTIGRPRVKPSFPIWWAPSNGSGRPLACRRSLQHAGPDHGRPDHGHGAVAWIWDAVAVAPAPAAVQAMRTEIGLPSSSIRLSGLCYNFWRRARGAVNRVRWLVTLPRTRAVRGQAGPPRPEPRRRAQTRARRCGPRRECRP